MLNLPVVKFRKKFYITTAIAYPNSSPHLGHALEIIQADVIARFHRLLGKDVFFQTGTDEHGNKNWQTAKKEGRDIKKFLDGNVAVFRDLYKELNISHDQFIRTTDKKLHYPGAIKLWKQLEKEGDIYKKNYNGLYCTGCEAFKTEKELESGKCPNHPTRDIEIVEEENYFFRLSKYRDKVAKIIKNDEYMVIPMIRKNEILSFLKIANDISFSRPKASLPWGIPVPSDKSQVMYVWCDALSNYITGVGYGTDEKKFRKLWPADIHIIGKDILRFHAAFWPAMLLSAKIPLPKQLFVHGFVLSRGTKMGKSTGNVIEPFEQIRKYGIDVFRYCIIKSMPLEGDGEYSEDLLVERTNSELVSNLGNFCYRIMSFANRYFEGRIKKIDDNKKLINEINNKIKDIEKNYNEFNFTEVIKDILHISSLGNKYFQDNEPWKLVRAHLPEDIGSNILKNREKAHKIVGLGANIAKNLSILISPILPNISEELQRQLNLKALAWKDLGFNLKNHKLNKEKILVEKIEEAEHEEFPLDLKVARILKVDDHPNADKLYVLQISLGKEKRQLVAGLKGHYSKEELEGKKVVVITNLKYAKLRGIESQGMLLAGDDGKNVGVLTAEKSTEGQQVAPEGFAVSDKQMAFDDFLKLQITVHAHKAIYCGKELKAGRETVNVEKAADGARIR